MQQVKESDLALLRRPPTRFDWTPAMTPQRRRRGPAEADERINQALEKLDRSYKDLVTGPAFMEAMRFAATQPNYS
jgi:hypothetical protein